MSDKKFSIPEMSSNTRVLFGRVGRMAVGELLTYKELAALIGVDPRSTKFRGWLRSACNAARREHGVVVASVLREGIKRLGPDELPSLGDAAQKRIRNCASAAVRKIMSGIKATPANGEALVAVNVRLSMLGALTAFSATRTSQRVESAVRKNGNAELAVQRTLEAFGSDVRSNGGGA